MEFSFGSNSKGEREMLFAQGQENRISQEVDMKRREVRSAQDVDVGKAKMTRVFIPFLAIAARGKRRGGGGWEVVGGIGNVISGLT